MARIDQSEDWRDRHAPTISSFESLATGCFDDIPPQEN